MPDYNASASNKETWIVYEDSCLFLNCFVFESNLLFFKVMDPILDIALFRKDLLLSYSDMGLGMVYILLKHNVYSIGICHMK